MGSNQTGEIQNVIREESAREFNPQSKDEIQTNKMLGRGFSSVEEIENNLSISDDSTVYDFGEYGGIYDLKEPGFQRVLLNYLPEGSILFSDEDNFILSEMGMKAIELFKQDIAKMQGRKRAEGSPPQGEIVEEQVNTENVGIMDGFSDEGGEEEAMAILEEGERAKNEIDDTSTYDELMRSIRGDDLSEADRRQELASYVGEKDAEETPDSVLTLVQPVMQMLDQDSANTGIGQIEEGQEMSSIAPTQQDAEEMMAMNMPQQPVGVANGGYMSSFPNQNLNTESLSASDNIDDRIMQNLQFERMAPGMMGYANGGQVQPIQHFNQAGLVKSYKEDYLPLYMELMQGYSDPERNKANTLMDISKLALAYGRGDVDLSQAGSMFLDSTQKRVNTEDAKEKALEMQLKSGALSSAIAADTAAKAAAAKATNTLVKTGNAEIDSIIAGTLNMSLDQFNKTYQTGTVFEYDTNGSLKKFTQPKDIKEDMTVSQIGVVGQSKDLDKKLFDNYGIDASTLPKNTIIQQDANNKITYTFPKSLPEETFLVKYPTVGVSGAQEVAVIKLNLNNEKDFETYKKLYQKFKDPKNKSIQNLFEFDRLSGFNIEQPNINVEIPPMAKGGSIVKRNEGSSEQGEILISSNDEIDFDAIRPTEESEIAIEESVPQLKPGGALEQITSKKIGEGLRAVELLDDLYKITLSNPEYFGMYGGLGSVLRNKYLGVDQLLTNTIGFGLPEFPYLESPIMGEVERLNEQAAKNIGSFNKGGSYRSNILNEISDQKKLLNIYSADASVAANSISAIREELVKKLNMDLRQIGQPEKILKKPDYYADKPTEKSGEEIQLNTIKNLLPPEILENIDSDPLLADALKAITQGADPEKVIERYNQLKKEN
jgi:hypothetical protein